MNLSKFSLHDVLALSRSLARQPSASLRLCHLLRLCMQRPLVSARSNSLAFRGLHILAGGGVWGKQGEKS